MKKIVLFIYSLCIAFLLQAQILKTVEVTAGGLSTTLTADELNTITSLTLTGTIDARDFKTMRDDMPLLAELDLSGVSIVAYTGDKGTDYNANQVNYLTNSIPQYAFRYKNSLTNIVLPESLQSIYWSAFEFCNRLQSTNIPASVSYISNSAFTGCGSLVVEENNLNFSSNDGVLYDKNRTKLIHCPISMFGTFNIPETVNSIEINIKWCI